MWKLNRTDSHGMLLAPWYGHEVETLCWASFLSPRGSWVESKGGVEVYELDQLLPEASK